MNSNPSLETSTMLFNLGPLTILGEYIRCHLFSRLFVQTKCFSTSAFPRSTRNAIPDGVLCRRLSVGTCRPQLCCRCTHPAHKVVPFQTSKPCTANLLPSHNGSHKTPTLRNSVRPNLCNLAFMKTFGLETCCTAVLLSFPACETTSTA